MKTIQVKRDEKTPIPVEVLAQSIANISTGVKKILDGPLNRKAVILLIQYAAPTHRGQKLAAREIEAVLDGIQDLERTFLKPKKPAK